MQCLINSSNKGWLLVILLYVFISIHDTVGGTKIKKKHCLSLLVGDGEERRINVMYVVGVFPRFSIIQLFYCEHSMYIYIYNIICVCTNN